MPYTKSNTYTTLSNVDAADITQNYNEAREYLNGNILEDDIDDGSIDYQHIVRPSIIYADPYIHEQRFTSGYMYVHRRPYENKSGAHTIQVTNHLKGSNFVGRDLYDDVADLAKTFTLERIANVIVTCYCWAKCAFNPTQSSQGDSNEFTLHVDGDESTDRYDSTLCYITHINGAGDTAASPPNYADEEDCFQIMNFVWTGSLGAGEHTVKVKVNPLNEQCAVRIRYFSIEAVY